MTATRQVYKCNVCGNIVEVLVDCRRQELSSVSQTRPTARSGFYDHCQRDYGPRILQFARVVEGVTFVRSGVA